MYRSAPPGQLSFENFYLPFGGKLSGENRWVKLAKLIPWDEVESEYAQQFSPNEGTPGKTPAGGWREENFGWGLARYT